MVWNGIFIETLVNLEWIMIIMEELRGSLSCRFETKTALSFVPVGLLLSAHCLRPWWDMSHSTLQLTARDKEREKEWESMTKHVDIDAIGFVHHSLEMGCSCIYLCFMRNTYCLHFKTMHVHVSIYVSCAVPIAFFK